MDAQDFNAEFEQREFEAAVDQIGDAMQATGLDAEALIDATAVALGAIICALTFNDMGARLDLVAHLGRSIAGAAFAAGLSDTSAGGSVMQ